MPSEFVLRHETATTEKALGAAARVEVIVGKVLNRAKRAMSELDLEDLALLVQHVRDVSAGPRLEHTWAAAELLARAEAAEQRARAASAEAEEWRAFAAEVVRAVHPGATGEVLANHLSVEDLPDLRTALRAAIRTAARSPGRPVSPLRLAARYRAACAALGLPVWRLGMCVWRDHGRHGARFDEVTDVDELERSGAEPAFDDPATVGVLLSVAREVWGPHCSAMASQYEAEKEQWRVFDGRLAKDGYGHEVGCGATETEALVAALETAAAALGGGQ
jgi:hypothetical protein